MNDDMEVFRQKACFMSEYNSVFGYAVATNLAQPRFELL